MAASPDTLRRLDVLVWVLIYGGLLLLVLGLATHDETALAGWSMAALGGVMALAGIILVVVRARMTPRD
jgi:drug/metabolite transporter superfamily protein YnfA